MENYDYKELLKKNNVCYANGVYYFLEEYESSGSAYGWWGKVYHVSGKRIEGSFRVPFDAKKISINKLPNDAKRAYVKWRLDQL